VKMEAGLPTETSGNFYNFPWAVFHKTLVVSGLVIGKNSITRNVSFVRGRQNNAPETSENFYQITRGRIPQDAGR